MIRAVLVWLVAAAVLLTGSWHYRDPLLEKSLEVWFNRTHAAFFDQTLDFEGLHLDESLHLRIQKIRGSWQTAGEPLAFEIDGLRLEDPATHFLFRKPVAVQFERFRPQGSAYPGIAGKAVLYLDRDETLELDARFLGLYLEELIALDPEHLRGASGKMTGEFHFKTKKTGDQEFRLNLEVTPPGGKLQARFFDLLIPYLPSAEKAVLQTIRSAQTVSYREADLALELASPEAVKLFLSIAVPDYNLNLNLNVTLRVESQEAFHQLAELFGFIKVEG